MARVVTVLALTALSVKGQSFISFEIGQPDSPTGTPHLHDVAPRQDSPLSHPRFQNVAPGHSTFRNPRAHIENIPSIQEGFLDRFPIFAKTGNLVKDSKAMAEAAKALFKFLEGSEEAQKTFDLVFETSGCLGNVKDVIGLMDETVKLVEENAPEILYLGALVENLRDEKDVIKQVEDSSKMLRALGYLIPSLSNLSPELCISSPEDSIRSFKSLSLALIHIKNHRDIPTDDIVRQHLEFSSKVMSDTAVFLTQMLKSLHHFKNKCKNNEMKDAAVYDTIADIMESLADFFLVLGFDDKVAAIKRQVILLRRITRPFEELAEFNVLDTGLTCEFEQGSYEQLALTLEDIAELIKGVGLEKLSEDLGIDFELGLIYDI